MLRYALYARKSKEDKSGQIKSIQDQVDVWRSLASERGLAIAEVYEENKTASVPGVRPVYNRMIADIRAGRIDGILVWHVNRLARNMEEGGALAQMLIDRKILEIQTPHWTYRPTDNILPLLLEQGTSTQYSIDLSQRVTMGIASMVRDGGWPHQAKVGYLNARDPLNPKRGIIVRDPDRFGLVRRGFDMMLTGAYSVKQVVDVMNGEWGFRTRPTPTRPNSPLSYAAAYDIFTSDFYAGFITHNGEQHRGRHEPMITVQEYNRLQQVVRGRGKPRRREHSHPYAGLITCGLCGMRASGERHVRPGRVYTYYHCSDPYLRCTKKGIPMERLEAEIVRCLDGVTLDRELCAIALENVLRWNGNEAQDVEEVRHSQELALAEVDRQREGLLDMALKGLLTDEVLYKGKEEALLRERRELQMRVEQSRQEAEHVRATAHAVAAYLQQARDRFLVGDAETKREIARALAARYVLRGNDLTIEIDPLLLEFVNYANRIRAKLETPDRRFLTCYSASATNLSCGGRDSRCSLEPGPHLIYVLRERTFPGIFSL